MNARPRDIGTATGGKAEQHGAIMRYFVPCHKDGWTVAGIPSFLRRRSASDGEGRICDVPFTRVASSTQSACRVLRAGSTVLCALILLLAAPAQRAHAGKVLSAELLIRQCANDLRDSAGLSRLTPSSALGRAARLQARNMPRWQFFDHEDPLGRGPDARVAKYDANGIFDGVGENIAAGHRSVRSACSGWKQSSGHRDNMLYEAYTHVGGGYARSDGRAYYVQVFGVVSSEPEPEPEEPPDPDPLPDPEFPRFLYGSLARISGE